METLSRHRLSGNAYRILGLPADASQRAVDGAARRMRIWPDPQRIPPSPWDLPWLGPVPRSRNDLERAVSELMNPATRIEQRILWYSGGGELLAPCTAPDLERIAPQLAAAGTASAQHDAILAQIHLAILLDPQGDSEQLWTRTVAGVRELAASEPYRAWLLEVDESGSFQIPLRPEEVAHALDGWAEALLGVLVTHVQESLVGGNTQQGARLHRLMQNLSPTPAGLRAEVPVLDRMEDLLQQRCQEMMEDLRAHVVIDPGNFAQHQQSNARACRSSASFYQEMVQPLLNELESLCEGNEDHIRRVRSPVARAVAMSGTAWVWSGQYMKADLAFRSALELAKGSTLEARIRADLEENQPRARQESVTFRSLVGGIPSNATIVTAAPSSGEPVLINSAHPKRARPVTSPVAVPADVPRQFVTGPRKRHAQQLWSRTFCIVGLLFVVALIRVVALNSTSDPILPAPSPVDRQFREQLIRNQVRQQNSVPAPTLSKLYPPPKRPEFLAVPAAPAGSVLPAPPAAPPAMAFPLSRKSEYPPAPATPAALPYTPAKMPEYQDATAVRIPTLTSMERNPWPAPTRAPTPPSPSAPPQWRNDPTPVDPFSTASGLTLDPVIAKPRPTAPAGPTPERNR